MPSAPVAVLNEWDSPMKQPAQQSEEPRVVGLASENKLPAAFKAKTNEDAGTVELRRPNHRPVDIAISSYQSAANLLAAFAKDGEPSLDPGATVTITDNFSGRSITITANSFVDAAAVFQAFVVRKGRYKPSIDVGAEEDAPQVRAAKKTATAQKSASAKASAALSTPGKKTASGSPSKAAKPATPSPKPAAGKTGKPKPTAERAVATDGDHRKGSLAGFPSWAKGNLKAEYADEAWGFRLVATKLSLDKENGKSVVGVDDGKADHHGFGYELLIHGKHVGWVIAEAPDAFHLTGIENYETTRHRNMEPAVLIRIRRTIYPMLGYPEPASA